MRVSLAGLRFPGLAAVSGGDDRAECTDRPAQQWILRCEGYREEMIAHAARPQYPFLAAVVGGQHDAARACDDDPRTILDVEAVKGRIGRSFLFSPLKTAVVRRQHDSVRADRPTAFFVRRKADGTDGIALW